VRFTGVKGVLGVAARLLRSEDLLQIHPLKQVEEGGIAGCLGQSKTQNGAELLMMPFGETLKIPGVKRQPLRMPRMAINSSNHWG